VYRLIAVLLALAACAPTVPPVSVGRYRSPDAPMYSNAVLDPSRLVGSWVQVADFAAKSGACVPGGVEITRAAKGLAVAYQLCLSGNLVQGAGAMQPDGPGRFVVPGQPGPWWVLWADADYRTLVIGTPNGRLGFILNRDGALPPDRLVAAREILDWNGYDLRRLQMLR
jgi:apolipoprotein D and lipocalin family protein